jgi:CHAT domain-containing protein
MSLDEARNVSAPFTGRRLVPPPRTITDIAAVLPRAEASATAVVSTFARQPRDVERSDPEKWGGRYYVDGRHSRARGDFRRAIAAFSAAAELMPPLTVTDLSYSTGELYDFGTAALRELGETEASAGNYWNAISAFERAIRPWSGKPGWPEIYSGLAEAYARAGDLKAATRTLRQLEYAADGAVYGRRQSLPERNPVIRAENESAVMATRAAVLQAAGQLDEAEKYWRQSIRRLDAFPTNRWAKTRRELRMSRLAECLLRQGRLVEAEIEARATIRDRARNYEALPWSYDQPGTVTLLARILRAQGRYAESETLARAAAAAFKQGGASPIASLPVIAPRLEMAAVLAAQGRWSESLDEYRSAQNDLADDRLWDRLVVTDPAFLYALVRAGRLLEATGALDRALVETERTRGATHGTTAELRGLRAIVHLANGERAKALQGFRLASAALIDRRTERDDEVTTEGEQGLRLRTIFGAYVGQLAADGDTAEAFRIAEVVHARSVQRALDASAARAAARDGALADLVRREQDAAKQIAALQGLLATGFTGGEEFRSEADLRQRIEMLRTARRTLAAQIHKDFPAYAQLVNPSPITIDQARAALRADEALVSTLVTDEFTYIWSARATGDIAFAAVPITEGQLIQSVGRVRQALDSQVKTLGDVQPFDVSTSHELFRTLLAPVRRGWADAERLLIVAHGPVAQLPFAALPMTPPPSHGDEAPLFARYRHVQWLIRRHAVTTLPSVGALVTLRRSPSGSPDRRPFVGFGDPYFNVEQASGAAQAAAPLSVGHHPGRDYVVAVRNVVMSPGADINTSKLAMLPRLPDTADEIRSIARVMNADLERDVFLGARANEKNVRTLDLAKYRVIAFATHGLVPGDLDGLTQPALALTAPEVATIDGDGLLTMEKILALRLDADWVVLSACNTANGAGTGAEAISGLGRAFFYAGARALLVTQWPVETTSARALTTGLFKRQADDPSRTRAKALQQTMNALIDDGGFIDSATGKMVFSYAHPIFWAPFALVGDGG